MLAFFLTEGGGDIQEKAGAPDDVASNFLRLASILGDKPAETSEGEASDETPSEAKPNGDGEPMTATPSIGS